MLEVNHIGKTYRDGTVAIHDISFSVGECEFVSVVGPSGCGKTTLLKCIAGLAAPTAGATVLRGRPVLAPPREMAIVFQDYSRSLMPWLTVRSNIMLPLRQKLDRRARERAADQAAEAVGLTGFRDHYPAQLSGGMQQRVAIARALAYEPSVLLLDEPFASVDAQTRVQLEDLVLELGREFRMTTLLVTHDIDEAVYMAERVIVLSRRPSVVLETVAVDLPWPRHQLSTKALPAFVDLRARIFKEIMDAHDPAEAGGGHSTDPADAGHSVTL